MYAGGRGAHGESAGRGDVGRAGHCAGWAPELVQECRAGQHGGGRGGLIVKTSSISRTESAGDALKAVQLDGGLSQHITRFSSVGVS
jgi:hypothetical protein